MQIVGIIVLIAGYFGLKTLFQIPEAIGGIWIYTFVFFAICLIVRYIGNLQYYENSASGALTFLWLILLIILVLSSPLIGAVNSTLVMGVLTFLLLILFFLDSR